MRRLSLLALCAGLAAASPAAHAGGLQRPTPFSARAFGFGGAFTAIADDPTALHYNPAGLAYQRQNSLLFGVTLIDAPRSYTPVTDDGAGGMTRGETQSTKAGINQLPVLGYVHRLTGNDDLPSRLALGVGVWNTFGGSGEFPKGDSLTSAINSTTTVLLEIVPGIAYEVSDLLALGVSFRLGLGLAIVDATARPETAEFTAAGFGAGASFGIMVRPLDGFTLGLTYRTPITANLSGSGKVIKYSGTMRDENIEVSADQEWPGQLSGGVAYQAGRLRLSAQVDWTDWSEIQQIAFNVKPLGFQQTEEFDFRDSVTYHAGLEVTVTDALALRAGLTRDENAIPDRTMQRIFLGGPHHAVGFGGGYQISKHWRVDAAGEYLFGPTRVVEDNSREYMDAGLPALANKNPGEYEAKLFSFELNAQYQF